MTNKINDLNNKCKYCNSKKINKMGTIYGKKRYFCRECKRTFREGEDRRKKYSEDFKLNIIHWYLENVGIRSISRQMKISVSLIVKWIKEFGKTIKDRLYTTADSIDENNFKKENIEILEIDELVTYVKKNSKILKQKNETLPLYGLLLIGNEVKLLDLKSETERKEPIKSSSIK